MMQAIEIDKQIQAAAEEFYERLKSIDINPLYTKSDNSIINIVNQMVLLDYQRNVQFCNSMLSQSERELRWEERGNE